jgi:hypothetical protein
MSGTLNLGGQSPEVDAAKQTARLTGRPVTVNVNGVALTAYPNGNVGTPGGGGFPGQRTPIGQTTPTGSNALTTPPAGSSVDDYGRPIPTVNVYAQGPMAPQGPVALQAPLNQANPNTTYVSPNTPQPATAPPVTGQTGAQSGPPVNPTYNMPPASTTLSTVEVAAKRYRAAHGIATAADNSADALNAQSLAAAQAGRTYFNQALLQPGQSVVNALVTPPATQQPTQQTAQNPSQQGGLFG